MLVPADLSRVGWPARMARRPDPLRVYLAQRTGLRERLASTGTMSREAADRWIGAWEAEARSRGIDPREGGSWALGEAWIAEQRKVRRAGGWATNPYPHPYPLEAGYPATLADVADLCGARNGGRECGPG